MASSSGNRSETGLTGRKGSLSCGRRSPLHDGLFRPSRLWAGPTRKRTDAGEKTEFPIMELYKFHDEN